MLQKLITLRPYQEDAVESIYDALTERQDNPCAVLPTGSGKTPVLATICKDAVLKWDGRVLILAHVKELLQQAVEKLSMICPEINVGIYSSGLKKHDINYPVIVAGIQSVYKRACELGAFDLIIIDEAHRIAPSGDTMYRSFLSDMKKINPEMRVIGLTATPYRLKGGLICQPKNILNHICYEIGIKELIEQGFICPLRTKGSKDKLDTDKLHIRMGEFMSEEVEKLMDDDELVKSVCDEIKSYTYDRKSILIFATSVKHGYHIQRVLQKKCPNDKVDTIFGDTLPFQRDESICRFKSGEIKYLINVNVLTTGFDAPNIDCVAMVRPTMSPGLYYQMVGRGFRIDKDKKDCLILDFGGNVLRHGPVDSIEITEKKKEKQQKPVVRHCPSCMELISAGFRECPVCGYEFFVPELKHESKPSDEQILSGIVEDTEYLVKDISYSIHKKHGADDDAPKTFKVDYNVGWQETHSEWICFEHTGYARRKAEAWWMARSDSSIPETSAQAYESSKQGLIAKAQEITVRTVSGNKYDSIIRYVLDEKPKPEYPAWVTEDDGLNDDVPF